MVLVGIGIAMTIGMPILYAVMGFIMGVIGAWFYNVIAKWIGGIRSRSGVSNSLFPQEQAELKAIVDNRRADIVVADP